MLKCSNVYERAASAALAIRQALQHSAYGSAPSQAELAEAGNSCPICQVGSATRPGGSMDGSLLAAVWRLAGGHQWTRAPWWPATLCLQWLVPVGDPALPSHLPARLPGCAGQPALPDPPELRPHLLRGLRERVSAPAYVMCSNAPKIIYAKNPTKNMASLQVV